MLFDGHAIIHRAFHAIHHLTTPSGEPINAVFGFTSILLNIIEIEQPDFFAITFDRKGPTFRHHADKEYKATRTKCPNELIMQIKKVYEIARAFSIPIFAKKGFEADDLLGTICREVEKEPNLKTIITSGDSDLLQLITPKVSVHDLTGGYRKSVNFTPEKVIEKYGFEPRFITDFKGMAGDASDNIKGVAGIGTKTATRLIQQFGTIENIYQHLTEIKSTIREKLERNRESAFHAKKMATIRCDAQLDFDLASCRTSKIDQETVLELFHKLNFVSLERRFKKIFSPLKNEPSIQQSLF